MSDNQGGMEWGGVAMGQYPGNMDRECVRLCDALNMSPGIQTVASCCGHGKQIPGFFVLFLAIALIGFFVIFFDILLPLNRIMFCVFQSSSR